MPKIENYEALRAEALKLIEEKRRLRESAEGQPVAPDDEWMTFATVDEAIEFLLSQSTKKS